MGTRSLTRFIETYKSTSTGRKRTNKIVTMYRQYDGYPTGHGLELAQFLAGGELVNGLGYDNPERVFNGMGCLTAQVVAHFKEGAGGIYLQPNNSKDYEDYNYTVVGDFDTKELKIIVRHWDSKEKLFEGTPAEFLESELVKEEA